MNELALHIFIGSMVLVKDFYDAYGESYPEPAQHETALAIFSMGFFMDHACRIGLGPNIRDLLRKELPPILAKKVKTDLSDYYTATEQTADQHLREVMDLFAKEPSIDAARAAFELHICKDVRQENDAYAAYVHDRLKNMLKEAIPFETLVNNV